MNPPSPISRRHFISNVAPLVEVFAETRRRRNEF